ncbi:hypothetical protein [Streptomyces sp. WM6378]|nr:hypothetical protein [Streptomyces sp. WM6378]
MHGFISALDVVFLAAAGIMAFAAALAARLPAETRPAAAARAETRQLVDA